MIVFPAEKCEMLNFSPSFGIDSVHNDFFLIIDTDCDNSHIFFPFFSIFVQHVLIVLHRSLTGSAPSCPNIDKDDFPGLMKEFGTLFREDFMEVFVMRHFLTNSKFMRDLDLESKLLDTFFEIFDFFFWDGLWNADLET
jgi:hypothetical protein